MCMKHPEMPKKSISKKKRIFGVEKMFEKKNVFHKNESCPKLPELARNSLGVVVHGQTDNRTDAHHRVTTWQNQQNKKI